ncbi:unnamed protein product, partial [Didymodactylos carnosus]
KNIFYKRYKTKFEELIQNMKLKYENEFENYRKLNNSKSELEEYSKYCVKLNKSLPMLRILFHEKLKNDFEFKHYFKRFLLKYKKNLCQVLLNESNHYIPKSKLYIQSYSNDEKYNLFQDIEQLDLILTFLIQVIELNDIKQFKDFVKSKIVVFDLFMKNIKNSNAYLILLKESYLVFVRDHILTLYDREEIIPNDEILLKINKIKQFNEENLKLIHDSERQTKLSFIRQFRGQNWNEKLIVNQVEVNDYQITE